MAVCPYCHREMQKAPSCAIEVLLRNGKPVPLIRYGDELRVGLGRRSRLTARCHDCNVEPGAYHHLGCDDAECPLCGHQMLSCDCRFDEDPLDRWEPENEDPEHWGRGSLLTPSPN